ncbi:hypothetical protein CJD36_009365 [Flavipsychrobacter stenotrophus]|uniref:Uncharacterized protein n=1 Tax=Flavipsychrobacter stenotrophus TaxID=2077091 RepID=A0A2S7SZ65_9BACT|nr:hypothetical protein [Flavipsychrobacter stenotrophus]PQJ11988.1 hypothetical protein CJD36_009365 [Flavipsychrobacter stenotrophus]
MERNTPSDIVTIGKNNAQFGGKNIAQIAFLIISSFCSYFVFRVLKIDLANETMLFKAVLILFCSLFPIMTLWTVPGDSIITNRGNNR